MTVVLTCGAYVSFKNPNFFAKDALKNIIKENSILAVSATLNPDLMPVSVQTEETPTIPSLPVKLENPPKIIKAVYVTRYSASSKAYLNYLKNLFLNTQINAVVVDIKGSDGNVIYDFISDIDSFVKFFHDQNIYVIGRISVFEDPKYAKARPELAVYNKTKTKDPLKPVLWADNNGLFWLDPSSKEVWDYNVSLAKNAFLHGFDEVNFDYIRFPSDGKTENMGFPLWNQKTSKAAVIKSFFKYLRSNLTNEKISADLFGLTTVNKDDLGIGQVIEDALLNFDYVCPMLYPSHYANGFIGFKNPAEHPYEVIKYSLDNAIIREKIFQKQQQLLALSEADGSPAEQLKLFTEPIFDLPSKLRPWLQDFNMGAVYNADAVKKEILAVENALGQDDYNGFMLWNPSNIYTQNAILQKILPES